MAPLGTVLVAVGATLFAGAGTARPEKTHRQLPTSISQDAELVAVEGRGSMAGHCEPFPDKRVVLVTVSMDYFDMFTNWLVSAKPFLRATEHLHVIAEQAHAVEPIEAFLKDQELDYSVASPETSSSVLELQPPYLSTGYGSVVWKRPEHILKFMQAGCSALYVDIDTVWMKDPFVDIEAAGSADLYITDDYPGKNQTNLCTCFMYFHPAGAAKDLLQSWAASATGTANQPLFNQVLHDAVEANTAPIVHVLPVAKFPPGILVSDKHSVELMQSAPGDPTVYHANWRVGNEAKVQFFDLLSMWNPAPHTN